MQVEVGGDQLNAVGCAEEPEKVLVQSIWYATCRGKQLGGAFVNCDLAML
jgi:hypothetical protein